MMIQGCGGLLYISLIYIILNSGVGPTTTSISEVVVGPKFKIATATGLNASEVSTEVSKNARLIALES